MKKTVNIFKRHFSVIGPVSETSLIENGVYGVFRFRRLSLL